MKSSALTLFIGVLAMACGGSDPNLANVRDDEQPIDSEIIQCTSRNGPEAVVTVVLGEEQEGAVQAEISVARGELFPIPQPTLLAVSELELFPPIFRYEGEIFGAHVALDMSAPLQDVGTLRLQYFQPEGEQVFDCQKLEE